MNNNETIRNIIVSRRNELGISLSEMARRTGIPKSTLSRYENLKHQYPLDEIENFAKILGLSSEYILGFKKEAELSSLDEVFCQLDPSRQRIVYECAQHQLNEQKAQMDIEQDNKELLKEIEEFIEEFGLEAFENLHRVIESKRSDKNQNLDAG